VDYVGGVAVCGILLLSWRCVNFLRDGHSKMARGKKRKATPVREYEYVQVESDRPSAMIEGMTKTSVKKLIKDLTEIAGDYIEHGSYSRLRRFVYHDELPKQLLSSEEKQLFIKAVVEDKQGVEENVIGLFPQFQEVLDYKKDSNVKYYHTEKRLKVSSPEEEGMAESKETTKSIDPEGS
jgi:hypothetical protein